MGAARGPVKRARFLTTGTVGGPGLALGVKTGLGGLGMVRMPIAVLVLEHEGGGVTLVDTGWSAAQCENPMRAIGPSTALFLSVRAKKGDDVRAQLEAIGIEHGRVKRIIATHLHNDHVGGLVDFPDAEVITTERELESAKQRGPLHGFDLKALAKVGRFTLRAIEGPSRHELPASADLDDGITLLDTRGHTAGCIGVAVRVGAHTLVHLGDAAYTLAEARNAAPSRIAQQTSWDLERQRMTYRAIARLLDKNEGIVLTSHDTDAFAAVEGRVFT